jgi:hypothetical protein
VVTMVVGGGRQDPGNASFVVLAAGSWHLVGPVRGCTLPVPCSFCRAERRHPRALRRLPGWAAATGTVTGIAVVRALFEERAEATMLPAVPRSL